MVNFILTFHNSSLNFLKKWKKINFANPLKINFIIQEYKMKLNIKNNLNIHQIKNLRNYCEQKEILTPFEEIEQEIKKKKKTVNNEKKKRIWIPFREGYRRSYLANIVYELTVRQAERKDFYIFYNLEPNYKSWFLMSLLHIWIVFVRLRLDGLEGSKFQADFFHFWWDDVEKRLIASGIENPLVLDKELKSLAQFYLMAVYLYDEGLVDGDAQLAENIWKNIFECNEECTADMLKCMVQYIHRELESLEDQNILEGEIEWGKVIKPE
jgi:hypothetical protein